MTTWLTADWHIGESRFELMGRPLLESPQAMVDMLVENHNQLVAPDDKLIMCGDVCYQFAPEFLPQVERFNGVKTLIRGNHDRVFTDEQLLQYFESIVPEGEGITLEVDGLQCYATHYPTCGDMFKFNLVGHIHSAWKYQLNMLNVGVDVHHFRPVNLGTIPRHLKSITEYYDNDVWIAYAATNARYQTTRGHKSSYFDTSMTKLSQIVV